MSEFIFPNLTVRSIRSQRMTELEANLQLMISPGLLKTMLIQCNLLLNKLTDKKLCFSQLVDRHLLGTRMILPQSGLIIWQGDKIAAC